MKFLLVYRNGQLLKSLLQLTRQESPASMTAVDSTQVACSLCTNMHGEKFSRTTKLAREQLAQAFRVAARLVWGNGSPKGAEPFD